MKIVTNFDELKRMREAAITGGAGSRAWMEFAITVIDSFPHIYTTAFNTNKKLAALEQQIRDIRKEGL